MTRWYEDLHVGDVFRLGAHTFTEDEIVRFGKAYDPQYFHVDPALAKHAQFGGLVASGWHTACLGHRKMIDALHAEEARIRESGEEPGIAGPGAGVNVMEFKTPVRPGDIVTYELALTGMRVSNSLRGWGVLTNILEAKNQRGELVYRAEIISFTRRRDYTPGPKERFGLWLAGIPFANRLLRR